jgi:protein disulfide-isomerase
MKLKMLFFAVSLLLFTGFASAEEWMTDFAKAQEMAEKEKKPMLVNFTGSDWCGWCIKLESEVFSKSEFTKWAKENVILVKLDFPKKKIDESLKKQNGELSKKYGIQGFPTVLFLDAKGEVLGKTGYVKGGPSSWTKNADGIIKK